MNAERGHLVLRDGDMQVVLDAYHGGAIRSFSWRGLPVFRSTAASAGADPLDQACFPMVPFANRIAHGRFEFGGHRVQLLRNSAAELHPLHGQGWRAPWSIADATATSAKLSFEGGADDWPWRYHAEQRLELLADTLIVDLAVENLSDFPMPAQLGLHPYFPDRAHSSMQARSPRVWQTDAEVLPTAEVDAPAAWQFGVARPVQSLPLDHCFAGWDGQATLAWPDRLVSIRAAHCPYLHVYTPVAGNFFCVEPQSAAPGALLRLDPELAILAPGERFGIRAHFAVRAC